MNRKKGGFTLIEIMVVVVIIGLLATLVTLNVLPRAEQAKRTKAVSDIKTLMNALELYKLDNGTYPSQEQGLKALVEKPTTGNIPKHWREGGYLNSNKVPLDPWGHPYVYIYPGRHGKYDIISYGRDGEPGGEGEDADITSWNLDEEK